MGTRWFWFCCFISCVCTSMIAYVCLYIAIIEMLRLKENLNDFFFFCIVNPILRYTASILFNSCNGNAKSWLEPVIEHLVGRQGQPRGAQVHAVHLSDRKGWSQDPPLSRLHCWQWRQGHLAGRSLPIWGLPGVSKFFYLFLRSQLLHFGSILCRAMFWSLLFSCANDVVREFSFYLSLSYIFFLILLNIIHYCNR